MSEQMIIVYNDEKKDLPLEQLYKIFIAVGWSDGGKLSDVMKAGFVKPWLNSTLVVSAWDGDSFLDAACLYCSTVMRLNDFIQIRMGEPLRTSYGMDLFESILELENNIPSPGANPA